MEKIEKVFSLICCVFFILVVVGFTGIKTLFLEPLDINDQIKEFLHLIEIVIIPGTIITIFFVAYTFARSSLWIKNLYSWIYYRKSVFYWVSKKKYAYWICVFILLTSLAYYLSSQRVGGDLSSYISSIIDPIDNTTRITRVFPSALLLFGIPLFFVSIYIMVINMINSKKLPLVAFSFNAFLIIFFWVPSTLDYWWYFLDNPRMSFFEAFFLTIGYRENFHYSYFNLLFSTFIAFLIVILIVGSITYQRKISYEHLMRMLRSQESVLYIIRDYIQERTLGAGIPIDELRKVTNLDKKEFQEYIGQLKKEYPNDWNVKQGILKVEKETILLLNREIKNVRKLIETQSRFANLNDILIEIQENTLSVKEIKDKLIVDTEEEAFYVLNAELSSTGRYLSKDKTKNVMIQSFEESNG